MLCLESSRSPQERYELPLPSGSVYFQRRGVLFLDAVGGKTDVTTETPSGTITSILFYTLTVHSTVLADNV